MEILDFIPCNAVLILVPSKYLIFQLWQRIATDSSESFSLICIIYQLYPTYHSTTYSRFAIHLIMAFINFLLMQWIILIQMHDTLWLKQLGEQYWHVSICFFITVILIFNRMNEAFINTLPYFFDTSMQSDHFRHIE